MKKAELEGGRDVGELVEERMDNVAKKLVKKYGKKRVLDAVNIFEECNNNLYGTTYGDYSKSKTDWKILEMTVLLNKISTSLKKPAEGK